MPLLIRHPRLRHAARGWATLGSLVAGVVFGIWFWAKAWSLALSLL